MNRHRFKLLGLVVLIFATFLVMSGCGGSSSTTSSNGATVKTAKISGVVSFPSTTLTQNTFVAKRAGLIVPATDVTVEVYNLEGKLVGTAGTPEYDNTATEDKRIYSYSFSGLELGKDYVIKAKRNGVILKKLIEKKDVLEKTAGQSINSVSTAAVIVASKQLGAVLGDPLPTGKTLSGLSALINTEIKPVLLESTINTVVNGGSSGVTDSTKAAFANVYNIVVTAGSEGRDPAKMFTATPDVLTNQVPILVVAPSGVVATVTQTAVNTAIITDSAAPVYVAPTESAAIYTAAAKSYLSKQDIANAALNYEKALSINSNDPEANFGGAITSGMMLMEDPDVQAIIAKWGAVVPTVNQVVQGTSPIKLPFGNLTSIKLAKGIVPKVAGKTVASSTSALPVTTTQNVLSAFSALRAKLPQQKTGFKSLAKQLGMVPATAPSISEMQALISDVIIPKIDKINVRLAIAEAATTPFSFTVTAAMQGNPVYGSDVTIDAGELYTLDAALNIFQVMFKIASSYNFDIPAPYTYDTIGQDPLAMINSASFFTLKSTGSAQMASALVNAQRAAAKAKSAYDKIVLRGLGVGMFDLATWTTLQKTDFTTDLKKITDALAGAYALPINNGTKTVNIDVAKFFTNPLTKANLPTFGYDVPRNATLSALPIYNSAVAAERTTTNYYFNGTSFISNGSWKDAIYCNFEPISDIPDYTFNGILPGNTDFNVISDTKGILPMKGSALIHGLVNGVPNYDISDPNYNLSYESDGTFLYRLKQTVTLNTTTSLYQLTTRIQEINAVTGQVTNKTGVGNDVNKIVHTNGQWWAGKNGWNAANGSTLDLYKLTVNPTTWTMSTTPDKTIILGNNGNIQAISGSGDDIYYVVSKPAMFYFNFSYEIRKFNVSTSLDTLITNSNWINAIEFYNGSIYTSGDGGIEKRNATTGIVETSYLNGEFKVMLGGYFYTNNDGKLVKYAGVPTGGAAKVALSKHFGF